MFSKKSKIIKAHSISKGRVLKELSECGHLFGFKTNSHDLDKFYWKIGVENAATFMGFYGDQDNYLFKEIDNKSFEETKKQIFLYS